MNVTVGSVVSFVVAATSPNGYSINFTLTGNLPRDVKFTNGSNGNFTWNVMSANPVSLTFIATDSKGKSSSIRPVVNMCNCTRNGQCMWNSAVGQAFALVPCQCSAGYTGLQCESDINACLTNIDACYPGVACTDLPASSGLPGYKCGACPQGLTGNGSYCTGYYYWYYIDCDYDRWSCDVIKYHPYMLIIIDINECLVSRGNCSHTCTNIVGSYRCSCPRGYALGMNGKTCQGLKCYIMQISTWV